MPQSDSGVRGLLVANEMSLAERLRRRRWAILMRHIPNFEDLRVVDLGGTAHWWNNAPVVPRHVTVVNLYEADPGPPIIRMVEGDALQADELLKGEEFDLVFSNSLIEHLGGHAARRRFADVVSALAAFIRNSDSVPVLPRRASLDVSCVPVPADRCSLVAGSALAARVYTRMERRGRHERGHVSRVTLGSRDAELFS